MQTKYPWTQWSEYITLDILHVHFAHHSFTVFAEPLLGYYMHRKYYIPPKFKSKIFLESVKWVHHWELFACPLYSTFIHRLCRSPFWVIWPMQFDKWHTTISKTLKTWPCHHTYSTQPETTSVNLICLPMIICMHIYMLHTFIFVLCICWLLLYVYFA